MPFYGQWRAQNLNGFNSQIALDFGVIKKDTLLIGYLDDSFSYSKLLCSERDVKTDVSVTYDEDGTSGTITFKNYDGTEGSWTFKDLTESTVFIEGVKPSNMPGPPFGLSTTSVTYTLQDEPDLDLFYQD